MRSHPAAFVAFHLDGAWTVHCTHAEDGDDGAAWASDESVVGWTSV